MTKTDLQDFDQKQKCNDDDEIDTKKKKQK